MVFVLFVLPSSLELAKALQKSFLQFFNYRDTILRSKILKIV
jgi:hypothetical protein